MAKRERSPKLTTPEFRVSYPSVFVARAAKKGEKEKFSVQMIFDKKTDITKMRQAVVDCASARWGTDQSKWPKNFQGPWHDGSEKDADGYGPSVVYANASSMNRPDVVDQKVNRIAESSGDFYGGCYAHAVVNPFSYDHPMGKVGVSFGLQNLQKIRDGESFSGKAKAEDDFNELPMPDAQVANAVGAGNSEAPKGGEAPAAAATGNPLGL